MAPHQYNLRPMNRKLTPILDHWQRLDFEGQAILVNPARPDWVVPGEEALSLLEHPSLEPTALLLKGCLENQLESKELASYPGRRSQLTLSSLRECWFHLTSRCNLVCRHCLFGCSPAEDLTLDRVLLDRAVTEARSLGTTVFYFTGGEPLLYPEFFPVVQSLQKDPEVHVVVLSNGLLLDRFQAAMTPLDRERLHLQLSLDGLEAQHDQLRGAGNFSRLMGIIPRLVNQGFNLTLSVAVNRVNLSDLPAITALAGEIGVANLHFLWHFVRGKGSSDQLWSPTPSLPNCATPSRLPPPVA